MRLTCKSTASLSYSRIIVILYTNLRLDFSFAQHLHWFWVRTTIANQCRSKYFGDVGCRHFTFTTLRNPNKMNTTNALKKFPHKVLWVCSWSKIGCLKLVWNPCCSCTFCITHNLLLSSGLFHQTICLTRFRRRTFHEQNALKTTDNHLNSLIICL